MQQRMTAALLASAFVATNMIVQSLAAERPANLPAPLTDAHFRPINEEAAILGRLLFFDPILSGNRNIACATCHHPDFATADGVSLAIGEGGDGLGPNRQIADIANLPEQTLGRNAPALFNLGAKEFIALFHDGRLEQDPTKKDGFRTPLGDDMSTGFDGLLAAQSMFPVLSPDEMAGHYSENEIAQAVRMGAITGENGAWALIADRVGAIDEYRDLFALAYPEIDAKEQLTFPDIANAIAEFIAFEWRSTGSPFDAYLQGVSDALTQEQIRGLNLFYGEAGCSSCHSGPLLTDHDFHAIAIPQFGPGKTARFENRQHDQGRMRVTGDPADAYRFRTPSLRNVEATAPYGHTGAYRTLEEIVQHHADPISALLSFQRETVDLPEIIGSNQHVWWALDDSGELKNILAANELPEKNLDQEEVSDLVAFLRSLTDPDAIAGRLGRPESVPSGLAFD